MLHINHTQDKTLLDKFPKQRPALSKAHQAHYDAEYLNNRTGEEGLTNKLSSQLEGWMHKKVARSCAEIKGDILEIGAGTLNHLGYEPTTSRYDIVEPFSLLYKESRQLNRISEVYSLLSDIPPQRKYSRIISIAVLEHLTDLPKEVALAISHMNKNAVFQAGIPCEGGLLWGLAWRFTTGISYKLRTGLNYKPLMRHEHVNTAKEIINVLKYFFEEVTVKRFPLPTNHLSFYSYIEAKTPKQELASKYLT